MSNYYDENNDFLEQEYKNEEKNPRLATYEELNRLVASKVRGSVLWMVFGLVLSGIAGFFVMNAAYIGIFSYEVFAALVKISVILELVTVLAFTFLIYKVSSRVLKLMFIVYSILTGISFSVLFATDLNIVITAFSVTALLFLILGIYGYVTNEDLTKFGSIATVGLITIILASIVNIFLQSDGVVWFTTILGIIVFVIFIAVDINRIKNNIIAHAVQGDTEILNKIEIMGALNLYLDFINLFLYILRILGRRK